MIVHKGYEKLDLSCPVVTIGIFDGVHTGHRALLKTLVSYARAVSGESVVLTFDPQPREVLSENPEQVVFLSTMNEKIRMLEDSMIDHLIVFGFTQQLSETGACEFISETLVNKIGTRHLIIGYDHHFGRQKEGGFETIRQCSESYGLKVVRVPEVSVGGRPVSSSAIRKALLGGNLEDANKWLGYSYSLEGVIVEGRQIGRSIGFPTANIRPSDSHKLIPGDGVYAVEAVVEGELFPGMLSIGFNPTVREGAADRSVEVHIFDFEREIYGREITVIFRFRMRDEKKFDNTGQLADQMRLDKQHALTLLS